MWIVAHQEHVRLTGKHPWFIGGEVHCFAESSLVPGELRVMLGQEEIARLATSSLSSYNLSWHTSVGPRESAQFIVQTKNLTLLGEVQNLHYSLAPPDKIVLPSHYECVRCKTLWLALHAVCPAPECRHTSFRKIERVSIYTGPLGAYTS